MQILLQNKTGSLAVQKLIFGTSGFSDYEKREDYFALLDAYYECGGRVIDTARYYGQKEDEGESVSERVVGEWIASRGVPREELVIVTKGGFPKHGDMHASRLDRAHIEGDLAASLKTLGLSYVDVYLLHRDRPERPAALYVDILDDCIKKGQIRFAGVSNWAGARIREANQYAKGAGKNPLSVSQIQFSLAETTPALLEDDTLICMNPEEADFYRASGLPLMGYAALSKGFFPKLCTGAPLSAKAEKRYHLPQNVRRAERVAALSEKLQLPPAAVALSYLTNYPIETAAVFSASSREQLREAMAADGVVLDEKALSFLEAKL